jgi:hypothetical protein
MSIKQLTSKKRNNQPRARPALPSNGFKIQTSDLFQLLNEVGENAPADELSIKTGQFSAYVHQYRPPSPGLADLEAHREWERSLTHLPVNYTYSIHFHALEVIAKAPWLYPSFAVAMSAAVVVIEGTLGWRRSKLQKYLVNPTRGIADLSLFAQIQGRDPPIRNMPSFCEPDSHLFLETNKFVARIIQPYEGEDAYWFIVQPHWDSSEGHIGTGFDRLKDAAEAAVEYACNRYRTSRQAIRKCAADLHAMRILSSIGASAPKVRP